MTEKEIHKLKIKLVKMTNGYNKTMKELVSTLSTLIIFFNIVQTEMGVDFRTDIEKCEKTLDKYKRKLNCHGITLQDLDLHTSTRSTKVLQSYEEYKRKKREYDRNKRRKNKMEEQHELFND